MYAIVEVAGKQYKVEKGMIVEVDLVKNDKKSFDIDKVLMCVDKKNVLIGKPYLSNVKVTATSMGDIKDKKVLGVKFKKRKNYTRTVGHRHQYTQLKIDKVEIAK